MRWIAMISAVLVMGCGTAVRMGGGHGFQWETVWGDGYVDQCETYSVQAQPDGTQEVVCVGEGRETRGGQIGDNFKEIATSIFEAVLKVLGSIGTGLASVSQGEGGA